MDELNEKIEAYKQALSDDMKLSAQVESLNAKRAKSRIALTIARDDLRAFEQEKRNLQLV